MKKINIFLILFIIFAILTFAGGIYVVTSKGTASPGYAVIPCIFSVIFSQLGFNKQKSDKEKEEMKGLSDEGEDR